MQPMVWAGVIMMTLVAGALLYFGWWTKAGLAAAAGVAIIVLAKLIPATQPISPEPRLTKTG